MTNVAVDRDGTSARAEFIARRIAIGALLAILLGLAIQGAIVAAKLYFGSTEGMPEMLSDFTQGVSWAFVVCTGVSLATNVIKLRPMLAGMLALVFAPIAVALAKSSQKLVAGLSGAAEKDAVLSLSTISIVRAVEYGVLAWLLSRLVQQGEERLSAYAARGALMGVVFGGAVTWFAYTTTVASGDTAGPAFVVASVINEIIFPIGCALVIYAGQFVGRTARLLAK